MHREEVAALRIAWELGRKPRIEIRIGFRLVRRTLQQLKVCQVIPQACRFTCDFSWKLACDQPRRSVIFARGYTWSI
jgi:hypothetical protein